MAPDRGQLGTVGPDILGGDDQAGIVDRLEGEFDVPALLRTIRTVLLPSPGSRARSPCREASLRRRPRVGRSESRSVPLRHPRSSSCATQQAVRPVAHTRPRRTHPWHRRVRREHAPRHRRRSLWHLAAWPEALLGVPGPGRERPSRPTSANAGPRRWAPVPAHRAASPCSIQVRARLVNEAGRAHTSASIRPRSCPSMSGRQHALQRSATNSRSGSSRPRARNSTTIATAWAAKRISGPRATPEGPASVKD